MIHAVRFRDACRAGARRVDFPLDFFIAAVLIGSMGAVASPDAISPPDCLA
ncbi:MULTISPECIES: hypothetical protein [Burkholderia]|uniref:hypothetical protein n=1 Tax=Burkholderia TaxID=32008 RepID=UPI001640146B|nr:MULTISPECIES: hypothetical protein [Burkholderia]MDN7736987.1 hypothetical protein [Burkholderia gladioli]